MARIAPAEICHGTDYRHDLEFSQTDCPEWNWEIERNIRRLVEGVEGVIKCFPHTTTPWWSLRPIKQPHRLCILLPGSITLTQHRDVIWTIYLRLKQAGYHHGECQPRWDQLRRAAAR